MKFQKNKWIALALALLLCVPTGTTAYASSESGKNAEAFSKAPHSDSASSSITQNNSIIQSEDLLENCAVLNYVDEADFLAGNHVARLREAENLSSYAFLNSDGTNSIYYFEHPVKFANSDGDICDIDLTLYDNGNNEYTTTANAVELSISKQPWNGITLSRNSQTVTLAAYPDSSSSIFGNPHETPMILTAGNTKSVTYQNLFGNGIDVRYTPTYNGVKEDILLDSYSGINHFCFTLATNGLSIYEEDSGSYYLAEDENLTERILLGDVVAYDANARMCEGTLEVNELKEGNLYLITVQIDNSFLTSPSTVYPVTIDPSLTFSDAENGSGAIEDCPIYADRPTKNHGTYLYNRVGNAGTGYGVGRTAVRLTSMIHSSIYAQLSEGQINSVTFYVTDASGGNQKTVGIHPLTSNSSWTESTLTWNTIGSYSSSPIVSALLGNGNVTSFNLTSLVKNWKNGSYNEDCGFLMIGSDETVDRHFYSSEYGTVSKRPYAVLVYTPIININETSLIVPEGESKTLSATIIPSELPVTWSSSDESVAMVSATSLGTTVTVTGISSDITSINIIGSSITQSCEVYVTKNIPNGTYYVQNMQTNRYMEVENNSTNVGAAIQQWDYSGEARSRWIFIRQDDDYYTIQSELSHLNIGVENGSASAGAAIKQYSTTTYYARWLIMGTDNNGYRLIPKTPSGTPRAEMALSVQSNADANGTDLFLARYTSSSSDLRDEWKFIHILPMSGYELEYNTSLWSGNVSANCNCYAYAINNQLNSNGNLWHKQQPGAYSNISLSGNDLNAPATKLINSVASDFNKFGNDKQREMVFVSVGKYDVCPAGTYKVALVIEPNKDYHWYRQDSDGFWSHKPGTTPVTRTDNSGNLIADPEEADRGNYTEFIGYFAVTPWNQYYSSTAALNSTVTAPQNIVATYQVQNSVISNGYQININYPDTLYEYISESPEISILYYYNKFNRISHFD